jgi:two-component system sensor histidine kinase KdpD
MPALLSERVMVCMSSNVRAPRVIEIGARMAARLGARCYAVYVATPAEGHRRVHAALRDNIRLAEKLGATVVRVTAVDPAEGLIAFAQREGITHVVFGESARSRWERLRRGSVIRTFLAAVHNAVVKVVP